MSQTSEGPFKQPSEHRERMVFAILCFTVQTKGCLCECLQKASITEANTWPLLDKRFLQYLPSCSDFSTSSWKSDL